MSTQRPQYKKGRVLNALSPVVLPALRPGDWVEICSRDEILATLGPTGRLDGMLFMPEMLRFCGTRARVGKIAHKTCDTISNSGARRLDRTVHLEGLRCDGGSHGGCEAGCQIFWKEAWLRPLGRLVAPQPPLHRQPQCAEQVLEAETRRPGPTPEPVWQCQTTELLRASVPLKWWDLRQYVVDVGSGNHGPGHMARILAFGMFRAMVNFGVGYRALISAYDVVQRWRGKPGYPELPGLIPIRGATPTQILDLRPGDLVQVKSHQEIRETLKPDGMNRGMRFDVEMVKYCGKTFRVQSRVSQIIDEKTGVMRRMSNPCIILQDVFCRAECTAMRLGCPRAVNTYWREIWLRPIARAQAAAIDPTPSPSYDDQAGITSR
jgi:hypothetical protein